MKNKSFLAVIALALGHLVTDMQAGALPIVLPYLKEMFALSYSQLAAIVLIQNITSSVIQPVFGYITDQKSLPVLLPFCAAFAGAGFALIGLAPTYSIVLMTVIFIGIASAMYHPQASKTVNFLSNDDSKAKNMGIFSIGGNAGMAVGSILMTILCGFDGGIRNTMYFVLPGLLVFGLMLKYIPEYERVNKEYAIKMAKTNITSSSEELPRLGLIVLLFFIFMRSTIHTGLSTYLPLFFIKFRMIEPVLASALVSIFLVGGVAGTYIGALLSSRLGARKTILGSIALSIAPIWLLGYVQDYSSAVMAVAVAGFFIIGSFATTIIVAQTMLPNNVGMAAGLTIGFSVGLGGIGVTILGYFADNFGLPLVMQIIAYLAVGATIIATKIPIPKSMLK